MGVGEHGEGMGRKPATYADLEALPANRVGELISGEMYTSPRPAAPHAVAASRLGVLLGGPFDLGDRGPGGWVLLDEPELHLGGDVLVPDLAGWKRERMPRVPPVTAFELAPDWVCEVLSPSTMNLDRGVKLSVYAREAVHHVWLVDPDKRTLEVLRLERNGYSPVGLFVAADPVRAEPFDTIELHLARLWE